MSYIRYIGNIGQAYSRLKRIQLYRYDFAAEEQLFIQLNKAHRVVFYGVYQPSVKLL